MPLQTKKFEFTHNAMRRLSTLPYRTSLSCDSLRKLLDLCVNSNFFVCKGTFYRTNSCPMGSPLSPVLASIFMEEFEVCMLRRSPVEIHLWKRYVDDTLVVVERGKEEQLLGHLNSVHRAIEFTVEKEKDGSICFLDVEIHRQLETGGVRTCVFRKPTATDRYLDFRSAHCDGVKFGLVSCLKERALKVCRGGEALDEEFGKLVRVFTKNGYPGLRGF